MFFAAPGGFEPPTSAMPRLIGRNKTSIDASSLMDGFALDKTWRSESPLWIVALARGGDVEMPSVVLR